MSYPRLVSTAEIVVRAPHLTLRPLVARYVGYHLAGGPSGVHRGLPSPALTFLIDLDKPRAFIAGLRMGAVLLPHDGRHHGIAVELRLTGLRALTATPAGALAGCAADLSDLLGPQGRALPERLASASTWQERFAILDEVFLATIDPGRAPAVIARAMSVLTGSPEAPRVEALARDLGWSRRHFSEVFRREVGVPPRQFLRLVRFDRSRRLVRERSGRGSMTRVALEAGYFDHPHMLREWRELAGCRPDVWLSEELLSVQAEADARA